MTTSPMGEGRGDTMREWRIKRLVEIAAAVALTAAALAFMVARPAASETTASGIEAARAWARPTIGMADTGVAYVTVRNTGSDDDTLLEATSDIADAVELHTHIRDGDVVRMRRIEGGIAVPSGDAVELAPGGHHVMLIGLTRALDEGAHFALTLRFRHAGEVSVEVPVRASAPEAGSQGPRHQHRH